MAVVNKVLQASKTDLLGGALSIGLNSFFAVGDYKDARSKGSSKVASLAKAAGSFAIGELLGIAALPVFMAPTAVQMVNMAGQHTAKSMANAYNRRGKFGSGYFEMTESGYTMRQRSLNAIRQNGMNINTTLGNEARTYYRGSGY